MKYPDYTLPPEVRTVREVYGSDNPSIPQSFEPTGEFRAPKYGEKFLTTFDTADTCISNIPELHYPRIIVRKAKRIIFMYLRTGLAAIGEWFSYIGSTSIHQCTGKMMAVVEIYKREEE